MRAGDPPARWLVGIVALAVVGCAAARPAEGAQSTRQVGAREVVLDAGARIDLERSVEAEIAGDVSAPRRDLVYLEIVGRREDGTYDAEAIFVAIRDGERLGRAHFRLRLTRELLVWGDPVAVCSDLPASHATAQALVHVLGAVPRAPPGAEGEIRARYGTARDVSTAHATVERDRRSVRVRADLRVRPESDLWGGTIEVDGPVHVRISAETDDTFLRGRARLRIRGRAASGDAFRIDERIDGYAAAGPLPSSESCAGFDVRDVVRTIQASQHAIRDCYELQLREGHDLTGTVRISMRIEPDGSVTNVHAPAISMPEPHGTAIAQCVIGVISAFHFDPGPTGGSVTYAFPFVFEPQP